MNAQQARALYEAALAQKATKSERPHVSVFLAIEEAARALRREIYVKEQDFTIENKRYMEAEGYKVEYQSYGGEWPGYGNAPNYYEIKW